MSDFRERMLALARNRNEASLAVRAVDPVTLSPLERMRERLNLGGSAMGAGLGRLEVEESRAQRMLGGAVRGLASALEPLQLPQDVMFAALAGALDGETTVAERLRRINVADYLPGGDAPARPASGEEIFSLMGFDETTSKWAGIAADVVVDPLVFGSWLRVGGKLAKVDSLVALGDKVDTFLSPLGVAREGNQLLRRSKTISAWQDARMARVLDAIRNPESVVFGIQNFGEKVTKLGDALLPRDAMLQLRLGREMGLEVLRAEQQARAAGQRLTREALTMVQNAKYGPSGDTSKAVVQTLLKTMEGQSRAFEGLHRLVTNPLERDFIEAATYSLAARQAGQTNMRLSFLTEVDPESIADAALRELASDVRAALGQFDEFRHVDDLAERLIDVTRTAVEPDRVAARTRLLELVGERGRRSGLVGDELVMEQRRVVGAFDDYLKETVTIDAKLGLELSGYPFISRTLRSRAFELTGDWEASDRAFKRIMAVGLTEGEEGLQRLRGESTGISLGDVIDALTPDAQKRMERTMLGMRAADEVLEQLRRVEESVQAQRQAMRAARAEQDLGFKRQRDNLTQLVRGEREYAEGRLRTVAQGRRSVLLDGQEDLPEYLSIYAQRYRDTWSRLESYTSPSGSNLKRVKRQLLTGLTAVEEASERYVRALAQVSEAPADKLSRRLLGEVMKSEQALITRLGEQARLFDDVTRQLGVKPQPVAVRRPVTRTEEVAGEGETLYRVKLARKFYDDHVDRDLPAGKVTRTLGNRVEVELSAEDYAELLHDARYYADEAMLDDLAAAWGDRDLARGLVDSAKRAVRALEGAEPASRAAPSTFRATREVTEELRQPRVSPSSAAAVDPDLAEVLFRGPADLYDELARLRSMADELRLDLERALTSKARVGGELETVRADLAARLSRIRGEVKAHRERLKVSEQELRAARKAEDAINTEERLRWQAAQEAGAVLEGVQKLGGPQHIRQTVRRKMSEDGPIPSPPPTDAMPLGRNTTKEEIVAARLHNAYDAAKAKGERVDVAEVLAADVTFEELLGGIADMQALALGDYLEGLMNGHLRRAYGLFMDAEGFERYVDKLKGGSIIMSNVLDEDNLLGGLRGFDAEVALIREYHNALKGAGAGRVLRRDSIVEYLLASGVSGGRVNSVMEALHTSVSNSQRFKDNIAAIRLHMDGYYAEGAKVQAALAREGTSLHVRNRQLFEQQQQLNQQMLTLLGDYSMASMSLLESASTANRVLSRQRYFEGAYKAAIERGFVKSERFTDAHGAVYREVKASDGAIGGFGGKWVHPYLYKELQRAAQVKKDWLPGAFTRIRSLITGGYLAAPAVLAANFTGGFYQAALMGINPAVMARRMAEVAGELRKGARGEFSELLEEMRHWVDLDVTSLLGNQDLDDLMRLVRAEAGMSPDGMRGHLERLGTVWENFLQQPFGVRWAGLEGFQFTENWFKVAAYKEAKARFLREGVPGPRGMVSVSELRAQELAGEIARNVVFDYSTLPTSLNFLKRTGLVLFPGFPFFLAGRTLGAALQRPGTLAVADRLSEAFQNISLTFEEQAALHLGMPEYLRADQGVPLPGAVVQREDGSRQASVIPLAQLLPTVTVWDSLLRGGSAQAGNPWGESLEQLGMWGPLMDVLSALTGGDGSDPRFTGQFGHVVFEPGATGEERAAQVLRFLYNTMAPSVVRRGVSIDYQGRAQGLVPSIYRLFAERALNLPDDLLSGIYSVEERRTGRPDKTWREGVVAAFLRTPQVIALDGPLAGIRNEMQRERNALNEQLAALRRRYDRARAAGDRASSEELHARMRSATDEFNARWAEYLEFYRDYARRRRQER